MSELLRNDLLWFDDFDEALAARQTEWLADGSGELLKEFYAIEFIGEVGELFNVVKKLLRAEYGGRGTTATKADMEDEFGDAYITLKNMADKYGVDLERAARKKFNATSEKYGFPHRIRLRK